MSSFTHSNQVFLGLPLLALPSTYKSSMHFLTHSSPFRSTCPNHLSLPRLTASDTQSIPSLPLSSSFDRFFFIGAANVWCLNKDTTHVAGNMFAQYVLDIHVAYYF